MNSWKQTFCVIAAFMLLVGGLTFGYQFLGTKDVEQTSTPVGAAPAGGVQLKFFNQLIKFDKELEVNTDGRAFFYFENDRPEEVSVQLDYLNCQCNQVDMALFTDPEVKHLPTWPPIVVTDLGKGLEFLETDRSRWKVLPRDGAATTVPAHAKGVLRVSWTGRKIGPHQAVATVITQKPGDPATSVTTRLGAMATYTPVVMLDQEQFKLPDIESGGSATISFSVWAPMRDRFQLHVQDPAHDPHFVCSTRPLTAAELEDVVFNQLKKQHPNPTAKSGYRVTVVVREVMDGKHLDAGLFARKIDLTTDIAADQSVTLTGTVHGDVEVGDEEHPGRIVLGAFSAEQGKTVHVPLVAARPDVQVKVLSVQPSYLQTHLEGPVTEAGSRHWTLTVIAPEHIPIGRLPTGSEILLQVKGDRISQMRVPIHGAAYE